MARDLIEHGRATMTIAEPNAAFVRLGGGEDREAIEIVLKSVARAGGRGCQISCSRGWGRWAISTNTP